MKDLNKLHRHNEIYKCTIFPETSKMSEKPEQAVIKVEYECSDNNRCDFSKAIKAINENVILKVKWKTADTCVEIVKDIENHQEEYLPNKLDGFLFKGFDRELVYLQHRKDKEETTGITGIIEVNSLQKALQT
jgi:hypothetical protein